MQFEILAQRRILSSCRLWGAALAAWLVGFGVTASPVGAQGTYPAGFSRMAFQDEFDSTSLNSGAWCTRLPNGDTSQDPEPPYVDGCQIGYSGRGDHYTTSKEQQRYREHDARGREMHTVSGGTLKLHSISRVVTEGVSTSTYERFDSSMIRSKFRFAPKAGVKYLWTQRLKLPNVVGTFPAAWLFPSADSQGRTEWPPEIDLFEAPLNRTGQLANNVRMACIYGPEQNPQPPNPLCVADQNPPLPDYCTGADSTTLVDSEGKPICQKPCFTYVAPNFEKAWHNYTASRSLRETFINFTLVWDEQEACYYIDNTKVKCEIYYWNNAAGTAARAAQLMINLAIGGTWGGQDGIDDAAWAANNGNDGRVDVEVDYVRVYWKAAGDQSLRIVRAGKL